MSLGLDGTPGPHLCALDHPDSSEIVDDVFISVSKPAKDVAQQRAIERTA